jgi:hypothetical protein
MQSNDKKRRDALGDASLPFAKDEEETPREPAQGLGLVDQGKARQAVAQRPSGKGRKTPVRPSEKRRKNRMLTVTFSDPETPDRIRELADKWGLYAPDGRTPSPSAVVEYLLLPQLEAAEEGEIEGP